MGITEKDKDELLALIKKQAPEAVIEEQNLRSFDEFYQLLLKISALGALAPVFAAIDFWRQKRAASKVKISYRSRDGENIEIEYNHLTIDQVDQIIKLHPPDTKRSIRILLPKDE